MVARGAGIKPASTPFEVIFMAMRAIETERLYTAKEFLAMPESAERYELIDGRIIEKDMPYQFQVFISRLLIRLYDKFDPEEQIGRLWHESNVKLNNSNIPIPDLSFWTFANKFKIANTAAPTPDLAIEIWSEHDWETKKRQADARKKRRDYLEKGVKVTWAINPREKEVEIYRAGQADYEVLKIGDILKDALIPGFEVPVNKLFEYE
jgi:Uma2 family endonuclease